MLSKPLGVSLRFCEPDAKFFFVAFWARYGAEAPKPSSLKQLAEELRLSAQAVSKAVAQLVEMAVLRVVTQPEGKGRPKCAYSVSKSVQVELREVEERELIHLDLIEQVLGGERIRAIWPGWTSDPQVASEPRARLQGEKRVAPVRTGQLSLANRLLLMILLSRADPFGIVRGLSSKEICLLTGMDGAALKQRLRRLTELGFIRRQIPGVASPIFTEKLKSIYLLNLNHLQLSPDRDVVCTAVHQGFDDPAIDCKFMPSVRFDRDSFLKRLEHLTPVSVLRLLRRAPNHVFDQLEFFICDCVSGFLSRCWVEADPVSWRKKVRGVDVTVKERVVAFFRVPMFDPKGKPVLDHDEIVDFFQRLMFDLADEFVRRFSQLLTVSFAEARYILVPAHMPIGHQCIALLILRSAGSDIANHWTITKGVGEPVVTCVSREVDIPLELREKSGLLTSARAPE
ncbi:hypothetical protein MO767_07920 [Pseudomonas sp. UYIF39]|uniref:hypothetical protein n=1 Tax=Pseudomonas sp. UYIF39 TaxID=1630747 RepID=UPI00249DC3DC|nr:hypothetical protein [Pseudomonas sp. UYIF39]MDI3354302.1 hypothetical protein [Pseudomonas sp. UYIF39]